jgi:hypothetical protein
MSPKSNFIFNFKLILIDDSLGFETLTTFFYILNLYKKQKIIMFEAFIDFATEAQTAIRKLKKLKKGRLLSLHTIFFNFILFLNARILS